MNRWTHNICRPCWYKLNPARFPVAIKDPDVAVCCFCGAKNEDGIYIRHDPKNLRCGGEHHEP